MREKRFGKNELFIVPSQFQISPDSFIAITTFLTRLANSSDLGSGPSSFCNASFTHWMAWALLIFPPPSPYWANACNTAAAISSGRMNHVGSPLDCGFPGDGFCPSLPPPPFHLNPTASNSFHLSKAADQLSSRPSTIGRTSLTLACGEVTSDGSIYVTVEYPSFGFVDVKSPDFTSLHNIPPS
jgi:hypothetical protein